MTFEKWGYQMMAFKNDKPQFQSLTGIYQAFGESPAKSIE
jgi:hypothetical protein